ncbi:uncharacterized protein [Diabrotica undecimpunctata]|uniref:uncharacterized protein n=1 Tax=Diabrotica undecimpunctata TaxID=50387 RepID=UPI003B63C782
MAANLNAKIRKRGGIKHKLTKFQNYFEPLYNRFLTNQEFDNKEIIELKIRLGKVESLETEFEEIQAVIEDICPDDELEAQREEADIFLNTLIDCVARTQEVVKKIESNSIPQTLGSVNNNSQSFNENAIKLPPIKCPSFNCEFNKWLEFKDTFEALFHNNLTLSEIQKYHYLRSCLGEEALKIIQSLEFAAHNYQDAWQLLCDRFDNKRLLVNNHLKHLFEIESLPKESAVGLRGLIDYVNKHIRALKTLQLPTEHWDAMIVHMISLKLDKNTNREWEQSRTDKMLPSLASFFEFLKNRADFLETIETNSTRENKDTRLSGHKSKTRHHSFLASSSENTWELKCNYCKQKHSIYTCDQFLKLSVAERWHKIKQLKLCTNCLCHGHFNTHCQKGNCKFCKGKHNSLLHHKKSNSFNNNSADNQNNSEDFVNSESKQSDQFNGSSIICGNTVFNDNYVILPTAIVDVQDKTGKFHKVQAILDVGSQCSFISDNLCKKLNLKTNRIDVSVSGIAGINSNLRYKCEVLIKSTIHNFQTVLNCIIVERISSNLPSCNFDISNWHIPEGIALANPMFNCPRNVDLLIGADLFWEIVLNERINLGRNLPHLVNTVFGYVVSGPINIPMKKEVNCNFLINDDLQKFWFVEEIHHEQKQMSQEDLFCEDYFNKTVSRDPSGKFIVRFPLKLEATQLGESKNLAVKRLLFQEKKLEKNDVLKSKYSKFMDEYLNLQHMRQLTQKESSQFRCFLPHFAVFREDSLTTDVRIVFDGSAKTDSGISLNDIQYTGPAIQNDIFKIMLRFRQHKFVVIADVEKMYRQILIHPEERYLQNILWRQNPNEDLAPFELQTVTYGTTSAPYLAIKCIKQLASDYKHDYPIASELIDRDMYVDDLITGFTSEEHGIEICNQISMILKSASFKLRKWASNSQDILKGLQDTSDEFSILELGESDRLKTLGIQWISNTDVLTYNVSTSSNKQPITKRSLLSNIAKIYDPLGLISPCIILVKILIQQLWLLDLDWDDELPRDLLNKWVTFKSKLSVLNKINIPRYIMCDKIVHMELHAFSDASKDAYSAVLYVRTVDENGTVYVRLLCSKTRVSPIKVLTVPRLELCGALALARLVNQVSNALTCQCNVFYWCDSQIVLWWLNTEANKLQVFVSNRVSEIQTLSNISNWSYVNTKENPADVASRGMYPDELSNCKVWWNGPSFLYEKPFWPRLFQAGDNKELPEIRKICHTLVVTEQLLLFQRFSSLNRLKRVFAYCLRFITNLKERTRTKGPLSVLEMENSMLCLTKLAQKESFKNEISIISQQKNLPHKHRLLSLSPFLDSNSFLRVGGRLKNSSLSFDEKHPYLLDGKHLFTKLIFHAEHLRLQHAGPQLLLFSVREKFWATAGMCLAKKVVRNCIQCFKNKPRQTASIMADLPKHRVQISKPFANTGIDYAGPVLLRDRKGRPYKTYKAYICLFICFATKGVHIELVTELTSEAFLATFRRFAARRGTPNHLYSDNGSNFVGAYKELQKLYKFLENSQSEFVTICSQQKISWHFIPPNTPHFGGLWESNIKNIKHHLHRVIGESILTFEEYSTLLTQIEATLNSRPLYPMSSDPNDLNPITPSHLLIGHALTSPPDPLYESITINRLSRFQLLQQMNQSFWKRWSCFYLSELQKRHKWKTGKMDVNIGDLVVVKHDNLPSIKWILGRIVDVHPGDDGVVRVVTIKTSQNTFKRGVSRICPLPSPNDDVF